MNEIKELRWRGGKVFDLGDGRREYRCYSKAKHVKVGKQWLEPAEAQALGIMLAAADYLGEAADGYIYGADGSTYANARNTSDGGSTAGTADYVGQDKVGSTYTCYRGYLSFDTSGVDDSLDVESATLNVCADADASTTNFLVQVYRYAWTEALADAGNREANYDGAYGGSATLEGTLRDTAAGWSSGTYYSLAVSAAGINKTGDTKYALVSKEDVDNSAPDNAEYVQYRTADYAGTGSDPYLSVVMAAGDLVIL